MIEHGNAPMPRKTDRIRMFVAEIIDFILWSNSCVPLTSHPNCPGPSISQQSAAQRQVWGASLHWSQLPVLRNGRGSGKRLGGATEHFAVRTCLRTPPSSKVDSPLRTPYNTTLRLNGDGYFVDLEHCSAHNQSVDQEWQDKGPDQEPGSCDALAPERVEESRRLEQCGFSPATRRLRSGPHGDAKEAKLCPAQGCEGAVDQRV